MGEGDADGEAEGVAEPDGEAEDWLPGEEVLSGEALALADGLGESLLIFLESSTTPHTLQVLCSVPIYFSVASSATSQSVAT